jgi:hypothetical protein
MYMKLLKRIQIFHITVFKISFKFVIETKLTCLWKKTKQNPQNFLINKIYEKERIILQTKA